MAAADCLAAECRQPPSLRSCRSRVHGSLATGVMAAPSERGLHRALVPEYEFHASPHGIAGRLGAPQAVRTAQVCRVESFPRGPVDPYSRCPDARRPRRRPLPRPGGPAGARIAAGAVAGTIARVPAPDRQLMVRIADREPVGFRVGMPVRHAEVRNTVVVHIETQQPTSQQLMDSRAHLDGGFPAEDADRIRLPRGHCLERARRPCHTGRD